MAKHKPNMTKITLFCQLFCMDCYFCLGIYVNLNQNGLFKAQIMEKRSKYAE